MEETVGLGSYLSALPQDVLQTEIVPRVGGLSMRIIQHTLLGYKLGYDLDYDCERSDVYQHGMKFFKWCWINFELDELGFNIGRFGTPDMAVWAMENNIEACDCEYSYEEDPSISECILSGAVYEGNMRMLKYIVTQNYAVLHRFLCDIAIDGGQLECLKYLYAFGYKPRRARYVSGCVSNTRPLELIKWMREIGCKWDIMMCYDAALNDDVECLRYAHENGCEWHSNSYGTAAQSGSMDCLKYLHENGCQWSRDVYGIASCGGHLEFLKYLYENGCPMDKFINLDAADNGKLDCLVWLHEHGYPFDKTLSGFYETWTIIELDFHDQDDGTDEESMVSAELPSGTSLDCLEYLRANGFSWDWRAFACAAAVGRLDILKWLHGHGYTSDKELCIPIVEHVQQRMINNEIIITGGAEHIMHSECLEFLLEH